MSNAEVAGVSIPCGPIITLVYRVSPERRGDLLQFLKAAVSYYEKPGGIRIGLYEDMDDPALLLELVAYESISAYEADQIRVESDTQMKALLGQWRTFFDGELEVRRMQPIELRC